MTGCDNEVRSQKYACVVIADFGICKFGLVFRKAQHPNITVKLQRDFDFTIDQINQTFLLPHSVALECYVKAFQYKVINFIFYTNTKLCKIGYRNNDLCTFCKTEPETSTHFFFITVPTLDNSGQILHHTGTYYQNKSTSL